MLDNDNQNENCQNFHFPYIYFWIKTFTQAYMNNYNIINLIGQGAYGVVLKAKRKDNGQYVAIKKFKETDDDELIKKTTVREIKVLRSLKHKNIVELEEAFKKKGLVHLVFQYLDNNLLEVLEKNPNGLSSKIIAKYIYQVLEGLQYMHSLNYVHRDIKPQNLLVNKEGILKICDMGFAKFIQEQMTDYVATRWYRPPQLLVGAKYGTPIDIWAVGCIMAELSDTQPLFPGADEIDQLFQILSTLGELPDYLKASFQAHPVFQGISLPSFSYKQEHFNKYRAKLTDKGIDLLKKMLVLDPSKRINASEALKHPYFDVIRPRRQRFQKTSQAWCANNASKVNLTQNYTDRNSVNSEAMSLGNSKSVDKQSALKQRVANIFFKFGQKNPRNETKMQSKLQNSRVYYQIQKGMNKIYHKKQNERSKYILPYHTGYTVDKRSQKLNSIICPKTSTNFKISQKKRQKSTYLINI